MTGMPAAKLRLHRRGLIKPGYYADVTVFSSDKVQDRATFADPCQLATGVEWVLVNGNIALDRGKQASTRAGRILSPAHII